MEGKEWFEKSKYVYSLDEHDESGYLGIDENKVAEMLDEYYQYKLKLLGLHNVSGSLCDNPHCEDGIVDYCPYYKTPIYCQCCEQGDR